MRRASAWIVAATLTLVACGSTGTDARRAHKTTAGSTTTTTSMSVPTSSQAQPVSDHVYQSVTTSEVASSVRDVPARVYVPNSESHTVDVIDPATFKIIDTFNVGRVPHHIAPAWDMSKLYVDNTFGDSLTVIDPRSGKPVGNIPVTDPYNLYFTPDGTKAIVVAERFRRLDFRDPHSWALIKSLPVPGRGIDHMDFSADGSYLIASNEFSGE